MISKLLIGLCGMAAMSFVTLNEASAYTCGPNMKTYTATSLDGRSGSGVRCVLFSNDPSEFAWYGEGAWSNNIYRHVGQSMRNPGTSQIIGYSADIFGNGETANKSYPGSLKITTSGGQVPNTITIGGDWNEVWNLEPTNTSSYQSTLGPVKTCGTHFTQYSVRDMSSSNRSGSGVRCVLSVTPSPLTTWYGEGNWGGTTYAHLGMKGSSGYGASDICEPSKFNACNAFPFGSLNVNQTRSDIQVTGAWSEAWVK